MLAHALLMRRVTGIEPDAQTLRLECRHTAKLSAPLATARQRAPREALCPTCAESPHPKTNPEAWDEMHQRRIDSERKRRAHAQ